MFGRSPKTRFSTPPPGSRLDPAHPLSRNIIARWVFNPIGGVLVPELLYGPTQLSAIAENGMKSYPNSAGLAYGLPNSSNARLRVAANSRITDISLAPFTIAMLVTKFDANATAFLDKSDNNSTGAGFFMYTQGDGDNTITFKREDTGANVSKNTNNFTFANDRIRPYHIVVTGDGSMTSANYHIYMDGIEMSYASSVDGSGSTVSDVSQDLLIGGGQSGGTINNNLAFNDLVFYNTQLTPDQVHTLASAPYDNMLSPRIRTYFLPQAKPGGPVLGVINNPVWA